MGAVWGPAYLCFRTTLGQLLPAVSPASSYYCMRTKDSRDSVQVKHAGGQDRSGSNYWAGS